MSFFATQNPLRAMTWIRVLNEWIYNGQESSSANTEDFKAAFPQFKDGIVWDPPAAHQAQTEGLRKLRDSLVSYFDVPADGIPGETR